jgi:hypothetical protein
MQRDLEPELLVEAAVQWVPFFLRRPFSRRLFWQSPFSQWR